MCTHLLACRPKCFLYGGSKYTSASYFSSLLQWFGSSIFNGPTILSCDNGGVDGFTDGGFDVDGFGVDGFGVDGFGVDGADGVEEPDAADVDGPDGVDGNSFTPLPPLRP